MLPFGRMLSYGNIKPALPKVKSVTCSLNVIYVLMDDGSLYARGSNQFGKLGIQDTIAAVVDRWVLLDTNVMYCSAGTSNTVVIKNDGTVIARGIIFTAAGGGTYPYTGTDITSSFGSLDMRNIKTFWVNGNNLLFLMNDGSLYGLGNNSSYMYGNDTLPFQTQPYLMDTGVTYMYRSNFWTTANFYIKDGKIRCTGDNSRNYYILGINSTDTYRTYVDVPFPAGYTPEAISSSGAATMVMAKEDSTGRSVLFYCGSNGPESNGYYDRGVPNTLLQTTFTNTNLTYMDDKFDSKFYSSRWNYGTNILFNGSKVLSCGLSYAIGRPTSC